MGMKSFKKKITLSSFRKSKNKKNVESDTTQPEITIEKPEELEQNNKEDSRIEEQENINTQNTDTRDNNEKRSFDDDVSSLLASSIAEETSKDEKKVARENNDGDEVAMNEYHNETQSESQENFTYDDSSAGYGNSKLCNVFKCDKESTLQSHATANAKFCGVFQRNKNAQHQQTSYEDTSGMITEDYSDGKPTTPRVNFCGFFG